MDKKPQIMAKFNEKSLVEQKVYQTSANYSLVYVNKELYKKIYNKPFDEEAKAKLEEIFSVTLEEKLSNGNVVGIGYADRQFDKSGIALSGNLGSGRAFFYGQNFNLKGEKTSLAIAKDKYYSDGKVCLQAGLKEAVLSNVLALDFKITNFQTLAVFDKNRRYQFRQQFQDENDEIVDEYFILKEGLEVRYYEENQLYRLSNFMADEKVFSQEELDELCNKIGQMEANKFIDRFLHGAWSVGNLSIDCNMLDFDTCTFVKGRHPQFSNTNKYKASYFGSEILGQKMMVENILEYCKSSGCDLDKKRAISCIENSYDKNLLIRFCDIIGLDYSLHYEKNKEDIDRLLDKFKSLSTKFFPNYFDLNVNGEYVHNSFIYDFSKLFQKYLLSREGENNKLLALQLFFNNSQLIQYDKVGQLKGIIDDNFADNIVGDDKDFSEKSIKDTLEIVKLLDNIYSSLSLEQIKEAKFKSYVINFDRKYLFNNAFIFDKIYGYYQEGRWLAGDVQAITEALIKTNLRNYDFKECQQVEIGLVICEEYFYYFLLSRDEFKIILRPFSNLDIKFAKVFINGQDYSMSHEDGCLISEALSFDNLIDLEMIDINFKINGEYKNCQEL